VEWAWVGNGHEREKNEALATPRNNVTRSGNVLDQVQLLVRKNHDDSGVQGRPCRISVFFQLTPKWQEQGANATTLEIFSPNNMAKKLAFFLLKICTDGLCKKDHYVHWFWRQTTLLFTQKWQKSPKLMIIALTPVLWFDSRSIFHKAAFFQAKSKK
jgi:hypothetical protein